MPLAFDPIRRSEAIDAIGASVGAVLGIGSDWFVAAICDGPDVVGGVLRRGSEVHVGTLKPMFLRGLIRQFLKPGDTTKVRESHSAGDKFVRRLGFVEVSRAGGIVEYELKGLRHV